MSQQKIRAVRMWAVVAAFAMVFAGVNIAGAARNAAAPQAPGPGGQPAAPPTAGARLEIADGSSASYRVQEQLAGVNFPNEAIGTTPTVSGTLVIMPDGSINSAQSKITIDLRNLKSDQDMRDGYIQKRTLETDKFPTAEFVAKKLTGVPTLIPTGGQTGFQLTGDLTVHGTTSEVTLNGIATFSPTQIAGRASTNFTFATFGLMKPTLARLLSVDDKIALDVVFKFKRS